MILSCSARSLTLASTYSMFVLFLSIFSSFLVRIRRITISWIMTHHWMMHRISWRRYSVSLRRTHIHRKVDIDVGASYIWIVWVCALIFSRRSWAWSSWMSINSGFRVLLRMRRYWRHIIRGVGPRIMHRIVIGRLVNFFSLFFVPMFQPFVSFFRRNRILRVIHRRISIRWVVVLRRSSFVSVRKSLITLICMLPWRSFQSISFCFIPFRRLMRHIGRMHSHMIRIIVCMHVSMFIGLIFHLWRFWVSIISWIRVSFCLFFGEKIIWITRRWAR